MEKLRITQNPIPVIVKEIRNGVVYREFNLEIIEPSDVNEAIARSGSKGSELASWGELFWNHTPLLHDVSGIQPGDVIYFHHWKFDVEVQVSAPQQRKFVTIQGQIECYESVQSIKDRFLKLALPQSQIDPALFKLSSEGVMIEDNASLQKPILKEFRSIRYKSDGRSIQLQLTPTSDADLIIHLQNDAGNYFSVTASKFLTIRKLKEIVKVKKEYPILHQTLKVGDKLLEDERNLQDFGIVSGAIIEIHLSSFQINILNLSTQDVFEILVRASHTISEVKTKVHVVSHFKTKFQHIFLPNGEEVKDVAILGELDILEGNLLTLLIEPDEEPQDPVVQLYVKTLTGKIIGLKTNLNVSVLACKEMIKESEGVPTYLMRLFFKPEELKIMEDHKRLSDYGIQDRSELALVLNLLGGR